MPVFAGYPNGVSTILFYGAEDVWEMLDMNAIQSEKPEELANGLADTVRNLHALFADKRLAHSMAGWTPFLTSEEFLHDPDKFGRQVPCLCGSGNTYKACHGAPDSQH